MKGSTGGSCGTIINTRKGRRKSFPRKFYNKYIQSEAWSLKREAAFQKYGRKCNKCSSIEHLEVHHKTYKRLGKERLKDLDVLCHNCHVGFHEKQREKKAKKYDTYRHPHHSTQSVTFYPNRKRVTRDSEEAL